MSIEFKNRNAFCFQITDNLYPGTLFILSAGFSTIAFALALYIHISLKGQRMSEVTRIGSDRLTDKEREERRIRIKARFVADTARLSHI